MAQTESKSSNKFNSFRTEYEKKNLRKFVSIFSLKTEILFEFLRLGSKLFYSIITDGKKELLKKLCFVPIRAILPSVLVACGVDLTRMR